MYVLLVSLLFPILIQNPIRDQSIEDVDVHGVSFTLNRFMPNYYCSMYFQGFPDDDFRRNVLLALLELKKIRAEVNQYRIFYFEVTTYL